ncbi:hypothetical protein BH11PLA1_BH11PLA1_18630 [soil metagenome]
MTRAAPEKRVRTQAVSGRDNPQNLFADRGVVRAAVIL